MAPSAIPPAIPMAIEQVLINSRLHFAFVALRLPLRVAGLVFAIGINTRNKRNPFSIGRPQLAVRASGKGSQPTRVAAIQRNPVNLLLAVARREKRDPLAVG